MRFPVAFTRWQQAGAEADNVIALDVVAKSDRWTRLPSAHASTSRVPESQAYPPNHVSTQRRGLPGPRLQGWRVGAVSSATIGIITLMINIIAVAMLRHHSNDEDSLVELFRGNCDKVETMHIWSHFLIVRSPPSAYCMRLTSIRTSSGRCSCQAPTTVCKSSLHRQDTISIDGMPEDDGLILVYPALEMYFGLHHYVSFSGGLSR